MKKHSGLIFAIISPLVTSIATILIGGATKLVNPFLILSLSPLFGASILFFVAFFTGRKFDAKELRENKKDIISVILIRQIIGWAIFIAGLTFTDVIKAIFFTKVEPYFVLLINWIVYKEKVKAKHIVLLTIHIFGAVLLSTGGKNIGFGKSQLGDLLVILSVACASLSYIPAAKLSKKIGAIKINTISLLIAGLVFLPFAIIFHNPTEEFNFRGWIYILSYSVLFYAIGLTLWFASLKTVKSWIVSSLRALGPLIGAPFAYFLLGETLTFVQLIGGLIVLATSFLIAREHLSIIKRGE